MSNPENNPCRSRLAGEGVNIGDARLKAAIAGKPAPTGGLCLTRK
ncbi:hypothetical protein EMIT0P218_190014 [Pseudomonas sp. IT-P218]